MTHDTTDMLPKSCARHPHHLGFSGKENSMTFTIKTPLKQLDNLAALRLQTAEAAFCLPACLVCDLLYALFCTAMPRCDNAVWRLDSGTGTACSSEGCCGLHTWATDPKQHKARLWFCRKTLPHANFKCLLWNERCVLAFSLLQ